MKSNSRERIVAEITGRISSPRIQISIILALTALAAFATSAVLLRVGLTEMGIRYPLAVIAGYIVFLFLLRIWIWLQNDDPISEIDIDLPGDLVVPSLDLGGSSSGSGTGPDVIFGGGGDFAGAGAGGAWSDSDAPVPTHAAFVASSSSSASSSASSGSGGIDLDFDLDEGVALLIVIVVVLLVFSALIYVVWIAPVLLAELIVDAAVVSTLYRPVKNIERQHWLLTALKKTGLAALFILFLSLVGGIVMQAAVPEAVTIGQFLKAVL